MVNVGKYTIHGSYGIENVFFHTFHFTRWVMVSSFSSCSISRLLSSRWSGPLWLRMVSVPGRGGGNAFSRCRKCPPRWLIVFTPGSPKKQRVLLNSTEKYGVTSCPQTLGIRSLTEPDNGFMEPKYLAFLFGDYTPLVRASDVNGEPGSLGKRKGSFFGALIFQWLNLLVSKDLVKELVQDGALLEITLYKWPLKWVTWVFSPTSGVLTLLITGPSCRCIPIVDG